MIRFIDLGKQIAPDEKVIEWPREFAFYDTIEASFISFDGQQIFDSIEDLVEQMDEPNSQYMRRVKDLIPAWVPKGKQTMVR